MPRPETQEAMTVALLYQSGQLGTHLKQALQELGASVVYETLTADMDRGALERSGARIVIVNLDPEIESHLDAVYDLLDDARYNVVFNDAQASSQLSGWDLARWERHLAAKLLGVNSTDPPRPPGAQAIPEPNFSVAHATPSFGALDTAVTLDAGLPPPSEDPLAGLDFAELEQNLIEEPAERVRIETPLEAIAAKAPVEAPQWALEEDSLELPTPSSTPAPAAIAAAPQEEDELSFSLDLGSIEPAGASATSDWQLQDLELGSEEVSAATEQAAAPATVTTATTAGDTLDVDWQLESFDAPEDESVASEDWLKRNAAAGSGLIEEGLGAALPDPEFELPEAPLGEPVAAAETPASQFNVDWTLEEIEGEAEALPEWLKPKAAPETTPVEAKVEAPKPVSTPATPAAPDWTLEDFGELTAPDEAVAGAAPTKPTPTLERLTPAQFLAPETSAAAPVAPTDDGGFTLELMPMEEALAPDDQFQGEKWLGEDSLLPTAGGSGAIKRVWVLGASIGGPEAVRDFLSGMPSNSPVLFVLAQHMGQEFLDLMAQQLARATQLKVRCVGDGQRVAHGDVLVVPTTHRLLVDTDGKVTLAPLSGDSPYSPSIDVVLQDIADRFGASAGAIIFSGMAHDAIEGSQYLKRKGGVIWAQDPDTCVISSMVDGAREAGVVSFVGSPAQLAKKFIAEYVPR